MSIECIAEGGVLEVVIDRPEVRNALDPTAFTELVAAWRCLDEDPGLRVAILSGRGDRAFCAGADLTSTVPSTMASGDLGENLMALLAEQRPRKPVIAAVNGYCLGAGLILLLGTDIRIASESATFGLGGVRLGYYAPAAIPQLVGQLGYGTAAAIVLQAKRLDARQALAAGLISDVVAGDALEAAREAAAEIAAFDPATVTAILDSLHAIQRDDSAFELDRRAFDRWLAHRAADDRSDKGAR